MLHSYHGFSMSMSLKPILAQICPSNFYWKLLFTLKQLKGMILLFFQILSQKSTFKKNPCLHCNRKCISNVLQTDRQTAITRNMTEVDSFQKQYWGLVAAPCRALVVGIRARTNLREVWSFTITEKAPTSAFSWLKMASTAFTFKNF